MEDLMEYAFNDLLKSIDEFAVFVPRNEQELLQSCTDLKKIFIEYTELVHFILKAISRNEE
jgi:hypothetical protein